MDDNDEDLAALVGEALRWEGYVDGLRRRNRHFLSDSAYFDEILDACTKQARLLVAGTSVFRARIMPLSNETDTAPLEWEAVGAPPPERALAGRLNPEGVPYFYTALAADTAVAEVRPWTRARLTVATFQLVGDFNVVDLRMESTENRPLSSIRRVSFMFGRPVHGEDRFGYLGMQYLAEAIKVRGLDGIMYDSALHSAGVNVAFFNQVGFRSISREVRDVVGVSYTSTVLPQDPLPDPLGFRRPQSGDA